MDVKLLEESLEHEALKKCITDVAGTEIQEFHKTGGTLILKKKVRPEEVMSEIKSKMRMAGIDLNHYAVTDFEEEGFKFVYIEEK
jgi:hypothetical protein